MNNSNLQNLTGGTFFYAGGIFNETGESTAYIMTDQKEVYITKLETANQVRDAANDMVIGWTHNMDHNGRAWKRDTQPYGPFAICADTADGVDWPHGNIVQHEVSHNFDADDQNSPVHPECIMNYAWAYAGTNIWCSSCWSTVNNGIYN